MSFGGAPKQQAPVAAQPAPVRGDVDTALAKEVRENTLAEKARQRKATGRASLIFSQGRSEEDSDSISVKRLLGGG